MSDSSARKFKNPRAKFDFKGRTCSIAGSVLTYRAHHHQCRLRKNGGHLDEWITSRTGIKARRIAAANEFTSDLPDSAGAGPCANPE